MFSYWEIEELAAAMLNKTAEYENDNLPDLEELFYNKFECDTQGLYKIVEKLLPMIDAGRGIGGTMSKGFAQDGCFIIKTEVKS